MSTVMQKAEKWFAKLNQDERISILVMFLKDPEIAEDIEDILAAREAKAEGGKPISLEDFEAELRAEGRF